MNKKSFYDADTPEEAMEIYVRGDSDTYGLMKNKAIEKALKKIGPMKSLKVLEVGCGGGTWTSYFLKQGAAVTCVDLCKNVLDANKAAHPNATCILGDATDIEIDDRFDLVFAKDVIEHIVDDTKFLENMRRHLKDGGYLIINTQNSFSPTFLLLGVPRRLLGNKKWMGWDPTHVRFYDAWNLRKKLEKAGFRVEKYFGTYHFPYKTLFRNRLHLKIFHTIENSALYDRLPFSITGWGIGAVARKTK